MKGQRILLESDPKGKFWEGIMADASYPGTMMQIVAGVSAVLGRLQVQHYAPSADNDPRVCMVLLEDGLQGKQYSDTYVSGTRGFLYFPLPGEEMNMLCLGEPGTGSTNVFTVGERMGCDHSTGKLIKQSTSANRAFFQCCEKVTETPVDSDAWVWCLKE